MEYKTNVRIKGERIYPQNKSRHKPMQSLRDKDCKMVCLQTMSGQGMGG